MPWNCVRFEHDAAAADLLGDALLEAGAHSVSIDSPEAARVAVSVLLPRNVDAAALMRDAAHACGVPAPAPLLQSLVEDDDWVRRTQSQFAPQPVGERLWIGASWHAAPPDARRVVRLDPGLAFGTGTHPSTRLVLEWIEREVRGGERILDYGCGSGILAIAALRLGAAQADATDIDPQAVDAAAANAAANAVRLGCFAPKALPQEKYDIVLANILAQPLIALAPLLAGHTASRGRIVLSGLLESQADEVGEAYAGAFAMRVAARSTGWALLEGTRQ